MSQSQSQRGGTELGRGFNGIVMDVSSRDPSDCDTLLYKLRSIPASEPWKIYVLKSPSSELHVMTFRDLATKQWILDALEAQSSVYIAKTTKSSASSAAEIFQSELTASVAILKAYGAASAARHLTLAAVPLPPPPFLPRSRSSSSSSWRECAFRARACTRCSTFAATALWTRCR